MITKLFTDAMENALKKAKVEVCPISFTIETTMTRRIIDALNFKHIEEITVEKLENAIATNFVRTLVKDVLQDANINLQNNVELRQHLTEVVKNSLANYSTNKAKP